MHRAVDDHRGNAVAMLGQNILHKLRVVHIGEAFVVHHDVVAFGPAGLFVNTHAMLGGRSALLNNLPRYVSARAHAFGNDDLLLIIIMAAPTRDIESSEWFCIGCYSD